MQKARPVKTLLHMVAALAGIQLLRMSLRRLCYLFIPKTMQTDQTITGVFFLLALVVIAVLLRANAYRINMLPDLSGASAKIGWAIATAITLLIMLSGLFVTGQASLEAVALLAYGSVLTPLFEETLFRGILWRHLEKAGFSKWATYIAATVLFALWHIGYIDSIAWRMAGGNLPWAMGMKVLVGLAVGVLTGLARMKTGNVYAAVLAHAIWNTFGR